MVCSEHSLSREYPYVVDDINNGHNDHNDDDDDNDNDDGPLLL